MKKENPIKIEHIVCSCGSSEHVLEFMFDIDEKEPQFDHIYTQVQLHQYRTFRERVWVAIKYIFGYKCRYGVWDCTVMEKEEAKKLYKFLGQYIKK